ncbi:MAG: hypothetical protein FWB72_02750 [Firmicutes bacterium]|nr:hypothetical protein [Bacillota bacterium]
MGKINGLVLPSSGTEITKDEAQYVDGGAIVTATIVAACVAAVKKVGGVGAATALLHKKGAAAVGSAATGIGTAINSVGQAAMQLGERAKNTVMANIGNIRNVAQRAFEFGTRDDVGEAFALGRNQIASLWE